LWLTYLVVCILLTISGKAAVWMTSSSPPAFARLEYAPRKGVAEVADIARLSIKAIISEPASSDTDMGRYVIIR
jgi:hypothetical protein